MAKKFSFVAFNDKIFPDGDYNGLYDKKPALIRIREKKPVFVSFIGAAIMKHGIILSSVELLQLVKL